MYPTRESAGFIVHALEKKNMHRSGGKVAVISANTTITNISFMNLRSACVLPDSELTLC